MNRNKNFSRKWLAHGLFLLLLTLFLPTKVLAAESTTIHTSQVPSQDIVITFDGNTILFQDFPDEEEFNYVILSLYGEDKRTYLKDYCSTSATITFPVTGLTDGIYYIQIYRAPEQYTSYLGYMWGTRGIKIQIQDGDVSPVNSPVYDHNKTLFQSNLSSKTALDFYLKPSYGVESDDTTIKKLAKSIVKGKDSDYEKLRKIHDWVCNNVWYDWDAYRQRTYGSTSALSVLESKRSVCQGYANLTAALLRSLGIPTKVVSGYALGAGGGSQWTEDLITGEKTNHAWNEAYVDGRWIILDTTWDSDNKYEYATFSTDTGLSGYKYFDPTLFSFSYDHKTVMNDPYATDTINTIEGAIKLSTDKITLYCNSEDYGSKKIAIDTYNIYKLGDRYLFSTFEKAPDEYKKVDLRISYSSADTSIATVSKTGTVRAKSTGKTVIKVTASIGEIKKIYEIPVTVKNPSLKFKKYTNTMEVGDTFKFQAGLYGIKSVTWSSSKPSVATVSSNGTVTAKKAGTTYIKISGSGYEKKIKIKVTAGN